MCAGLRHACPCLYSDRFSSRLFETHAVVGRIVNYILSPSLCQPGFQTVKFLDCPTRGGIPLFRKSMFARIVPAVIFAVLLLAANTSAQTKLLRFPDIHGDRVAFTYGGDIWTAPAIGGTATRLTAHPGIEVFAKFSPDGKWVAVTRPLDRDQHGDGISATR